MNIKYLLLAIFVFLPPQLYATEIIDEENEDKTQIESPSSPITDVNNNEKQETPARKVVEAFEEPTVKPFEIIGKSIEPGSRQVLQWYSLQSPLGKLVDTPIIVINGTKPGPVLAITAAIHGDELNGIEIIRQVMHELDPATLKGTIVGIPVVNLEGFYRKERYIGDRKDLNRYFPGNPNGSHPSRVAHAIFTDIITHCDMVIDLHTGSFYRENLPQLRVDLTVDQVADLATKFGAVTALQSVAPSGSLRGAATEAGIPAIVMEIGGPLSLEIDKVEVGVKSLRTFLQSVGMIDKITFWPTPQPVFYGSEWVRADAGGILINKVALGDSVKKDDILAEINNPITNTSHVVYSPVDGTVLGRAQNQFVSPGFALFHMGHKKSVKELEKEVTAKENKHSN
ncbi:MAG: succinylglutamate desuccinylase/aspartoacylase family protein [Desulfotalea sp.]